MQITGLWDAVARRWLALLIVLLLGGGVGALAWATTSATYTADAILVVVPPSAPDQKVGNPLSLANFNSTEMSTLVVTAMTSPEVAEAVSAAGGGKITSVDNLLSTTTANPQRTLQVTLVTSGKSPEQAVDAAKTAIAATQKRFADFQSGALKVDPAYRIQIAPMVEPHPAASDQSSKLRAAAGSALGLIGLGVIAVLAFDIVMAIREKRRLGLDTHRARPPETTP